MRIALIRHPRVQVAAGLCYGRTDVPLHPDAAIDGLHRALAGFPAAAIWTSPARRCAEVAATIGAHPIPDDRLHEMDFGAWEGQPWDAIDRAALDRWAADPAGFAPPGGESGGALLARVADFAAMLLAAGQDAVVVSHGGPLRLLPALLEGRPPALLAPAPALGSLTWVQPRVAP